MSTVDGGAHIARLQGLATSLEGVLHTAGSLQRENARLREALKLADAESTMLAKIISEHGWDGVLTEEQRDLCKRASAAIDEALGGERC